MPYLREASSGDRSPQASAARPLRLAGARGQPLPRICRTEPACRSGYSGPARNIDNLMRYAAPQKGAVAGSQLLCVAVDDGGQFALHDVEGFIVAGMDMDRRPGVSTVKFSDRQNWPAVCAPESSRFMTI